MHVFSAWKSPPVIRPVLLICDVFSGRPYGFGAQGTYVSDMVLISRLLGFGGSKEGRLDWKRKLTGIGVPASVTSVCKCGVREESHVDFGVVSVVSHRFVFNVRGAKAVTGFQWKKAD